MFTEIRKRQRDLLSAGSLWGQEQGTPSRYPTWPAGTPVPAPGLLLRQHAGRELSQKQRSRDLNYHANMRCDIPRGGLIHCATMLSTYILVPNNLFSHTEGRNKQQLLSKNYCAAYLKRVYPVIDLTRNENICPQKCTNNYTHTTFRLASNYKMHIGN